MNEPVAYAQVSVLSGDQASGMNSDKLRDLLLPFTAASRAQYATDPRAATFKQIADYDVRAPAGSGVHVVFSYDLGNGREVFDQTALLGIEADAGVPAADPLLAGLLRLPQGPDRRRRLALHREGAVSYRRARARHPEPPLEVS